MPVEGASDHGAQFDLTSSAVAVEEGYRLVEHTLCASLLLYVVVVEEHLEATRYVAEVVGAPYGYARVVGVGAAVEAVLVGVEGDHLEAGLFEVLGDGFRHGACVAVLLAVVYGKCLHA